MSNYTYFSFVFVNLHLIKLCSCCFLFIRLYFNSLSTITTISSSITLEILPASFCCNNNFILSYNLLGSDDESIVQIPEAMIAGDLSIFINERSLVFLLPTPLISKCFSFANSYIIFLSDKLARSTF